MLFSSYLPNSYFFSAWVQSWTIKLYTLHTRKRSKSSQKSNWPMLFSYIPNFNYFSYFPKFPVFQKIKIFPIFLIFPILSSFLIFLFSVLFYFRHSSLFLYILSFFLLPYIPYIPYFSNIFHIPYFPHFSFTLFFLYSRYSLVSNFSQEDHMGPYKTIWDWTKLQKAI